MNNIRRVYPGAANPTHDISLEVDGKTYNLHYAPGFRPMQKVAATPPGQPFNIEQGDFTSGRGRLFYQDDPAGYFDGHMAWTTVAKQVVPCPAYFFAKGIRNEDTYITADKTFIPLYASATTYRYWSQNFTTSMSAHYDADYARMFIKRVGSPGTLTFEFCADATGTKPGTVAYTVTKTTANADYLTQFMKFNWTSGVGSTGEQHIDTSTVYHLKIYGASTDNADNHWEVGADASTSSAKYSSDNVNWTEGTYKLLYRVCDTDTKRKWIQFNWYGTRYFLTCNDNGTASKLYINGDRGVATASGSSTAVLHDNGRTWTVDRWAGARVWIHDGTGDGQVRTISSNTADTLTPSEAFDVAPDGTSKYIIFYTPWLTEITGHGFGKVVDAPCVINKIAIFPQGQGVKIRRGFVNGSSYDWAADLTNYADILGLETTGKKLKIYVGNAASSYYQVYEIPSGFVYNDPIALGVNKVAVGSSDFRMNKIFGRSASVCVFKEDGVYILEDGKPRKLSIGMDSLPSRNSGIAACEQAGYLYFPFASSIQRMMGTSVSDIMNMRASYDGLPPARAAQPTSLEATTHVFAGMDGGTKISSVLMWNGMGWCETFRGLEAGSRIRNIGFQSAPDANPRMWIDHAGDLIYQDFPLNAANPLQDDTIQYNHEMSVTFGRMDRGNPNLYKLLHNLEIASENLGTARKIEIDYQVDDAVGTSAWTRYTSDATISPSQTFTLDWGAIHSWQIRIRGYTTSATTPPVLNFYRLTGWDKETSKYQYSGNFSIGHSLDEYDPNILEQWLVDQANKQTKVTMRSLIPGDDNKIVTLADPNITREAVDVKKWDGVVALLMRET